MRMKGVLGLENRNLIKIKCTKLFSFSPTLRKVDGSSLVCRKTARKAVKLNQFYYTFGAEWTQCRRSATGVN